MSNLNFLFRPKTIALTGASQSEEKLGGVVLKNLLSYKGTVYPVNPKHGEMMGLKTYPSFSDVPGHVDLSLIIRPAEEIPSILREHTGKASCAVIMSSGFAESGREGLQEEIKAVAKESGVRVLGPNCMGLYNPKARLDTLFLPSAGGVGRPKKGNVAVVTQSGAILHCFFGIMRASGIGISSAVTYGNALDIDETELYEYFAGNKSTEVVVSYIESVRDGRRFLRAARTLAERKPLIVLKAGKSEKGEAAAFSHTGRLAGKYEVFRAALKQFGIKEAVDFDDMADTVKALSRQKPARGNRVLIVTNGGGSGVLASDECMRQGLEVPPLPEEKAAKLKSVFPQFYGVGNPFDLTAQVKDDEYISALGELKDDYDGFLVIALAGVAGITPRLAGLMKSFKESAGRPVVFHTTCGCSSGKLISLIEKAGMPVYPSPERAVRALRTLLEP